MSDPTSMPTLDPETLARTDIKALRAMMIGAAADLLTFYSEQIPGRDPGEQRALARAMRHVRADQVKVLDSDRVAIIGAYLAFVRHLADQQETLIDHQQHRQ